MLGAFVFTRIESGSRDMAGIKSKACAQLVLWHFFFWSVFFVGLCRVIDPKAKAFGMKSHDTCLNVCVLVFIYTHPPLY